MRRLLTMVFLLGLARPWVLEPLETLPAPRKLSLSGISEGELKLIRGIGPATARRLKLLGRLEADKRAGIGPKVVDLAGKYLVE